MTAGVGLATIALASAVPAAAQTRTFDLPAQDAALGIRAFAVQAGVQIITQPATVRGLRTNAVRGPMSVEAGLRLLLEGSGLVVAPATPGVTAIVIRRAATASADPASAASITSATNDIVVTAQKREQKIQDVPIAISAFTGRTLDAMKIETGGDLLKSIPNVTFSKNNFAGYNFTIRGIGTKRLCQNAGVTVDDRVPM